MELQIWANFATVIAGAAAFVSAGAAVVIVLYTRKQLSAIEREFKETRLLDLTSKQVGADQVRQLLDEWLQDTVQAEDELDQILKEIEDGNLGDLSEKTNGLLFAKSDHDLFGAIDLSRISPVVAIQVSRIYGTLSKISGEILELSHTYNSIHEITEIRNELKEHVSEIKRDVVAQQDALRNASKQAENFCQKMRSKVEELQQWLDAQPRT